MKHSFGDYHPEATRAIRRVASRGTEAVFFTLHASEEMDNDDFNHTTVLACLRRGAAHGPEVVGGKWRFNVLHNGYRIRVVVGTAIDADFAQLERLTVVTVMRT